MLRYCARCVMPDTRPDLSFDKEGVCAACRNIESRAQINWEDRHRDLLTVISQYKGRSPSGYDCIVPVSGGKDSTFQVVKVLELGLTPLCVTATTCDLSPIGRTNIENLKNLGVDYIEITTNPVVRRKLNRIGLMQVGDISWPEHATIFTIPFQVAVEKNIPLMIWGENPQNEYGGPEEVAKHNTVNRRWLEEFGGLLGLRVTDLVGQEGLRPQDLLPYKYPSDEDFKRVGILGMHLGHYMPWDSYKNALMSQFYGFNTWPTAVEGNSVNYENLDNYHSGIHDFFKFLKFGFGRTSDIVSTHIRRGRLTRKEGMQIVKMHDGKLPWTYLGKPLEKILEPLDISVGQFLEVCDKFTNRKIFKTDSRDRLLRDKSNNLIKTNDDNE